ncbi:MAG: SDR family oxidoreductase [Nitrospinota bacterium]|nr:SDR family oxidoreductase [Nitrospinota bacterium]
MKNKKQNETKTVLITGTTSGIGLELSKKFAKERFNLVLVSRNGEKLNSQKEDLERNYNVAIYVIAKDISEPNAPEEIFSAVKNQNIHVDILVNNAGFNESGKFHETMLDNELRMVQVHIMALTGLTKLFLPGMIKNNYGKILNLGSTGSFTPCPMDAVYCATKAYVLSFSSALRAELSGTGVTVSTLCPGATRTEFAKKANMENTLLFKILVMEPQIVAKIAYNQFMKKNRKVIIPGFYNRLLVLSIPFTPNKILEILSVFLLRRK